eukprot:9324402-Lingulodinium_polyedra.AAC.1
MPSWPTAAVTSMLGTPRSIWFLLGNTKPGEEPSDGVRRCWWTFCARSNFFSRAVRGRTNFLLSMYACTEDVQNCSRYVDQTNACWYRASQ